jgi:hypothetical protein
MANFPNSLNYKKNNHFYHIKTPKEKNKIKNKSNLIPPNKYSKISLIKIKISSKMY